MELVKNIYLRSYLIIMALYVFLNKGVAYTFLVELLWVTGIVILYLNRKNYSFFIDRKIKILIILLAINIFYIIISSFRHSFFEVFRDSFIFNYAWFIAILFLFKDQTDFIWKSLYFIYKWFPLVALVNFILQYYVPFFQNIAPFGGIPILLYKNGDMGVHLLISLILYLLNADKFSTKWTLLLLLTIVLNFLILSSYSRSGMLSFIISLFLFIIFNKDNVLKERTRKFLKVSPWILLIILPIYANLKVEENFQGRVVGIEQIKNNFSSIIGGSTDATSEDNVVWRLVWWAKIINYSFTPSNIFIGKGLGVNLAISDDIVTNDETLRSPHNFHLNIMSRYGVIVFSIWSYWLILVFRPLFEKQLTGKRLAISCILLAFIFNASFDVFLEGPMGAFPFWTWVGLLFITEAHS